MTFKESEQNNNNTSGSLREVYKMTSPIEIDDYTLLCLLVWCDQITYEESTQDTKWQETVNEEIEAIRRNETWRLTTLPEGHKSLGVIALIRSRQDKDKSERKVEKHKAWPAGERYKHWCMDLTIKLEYFFQLEKNFF